MKHILFLFALIISASAFSQATNTWTKKSDFTGLKRERAVAFSIDNYGYLGTGIDTAETVHNDWWRYDPLTDSYTQMANIPGEVRRNAVAFTINGLGYVGTGINAVSSQDVGATKLSDMWEYNPSTNAWTAKAPFPGNNGNGIYFATAFAIGDYAYVVGGKYGPNFYSQALYRFDPVTDSWAQGPNYPGGVRYQMSSLAIGNKGYAGLGIDQDLMNNDWYEYKTTTNAWVQRANLAGSPRGSATSFTLGNKGYICMGNNGGVLGDLWEYDPDLDYWTMRASYGGSNRKSAVAMVAYGKAYVGTGKGISGKKQSMHEYTPYNYVSLNELEHTISVYPNPTNSWLHIQSNNTIDRIIITSILGHNVYDGDMNTKIDVSNFPQGTYILTAYAQNDQVGIQKITIQ